MSYPILRVHTEKIRENGERMINECTKHGISLWGVSKGISAFPEIAKTYREAGFKVIADSRIANIKKMRAAGVASDYALIRIPMRSELEDVIENCSYSLVSDIGTIEAMSTICEKRAKEHKCVIMFDMGDLREGFWFTEISELADGLKKISPFLKIAGVGANFSCASGVLPTPENLSQLVKYGEQIESALGHKLDIYSGGGTCSFVQMLRGNVPERINSLRMGEALLLGKDTSFCINIDMLNQDTMEIEAELVEVRKKPTLPIGEIGRDAFGNAPVFEDRGDRLRGILGIGRQDVNINGLTPLDEGVNIITASSDHLLVDLEDCPKRPKVGDILRFRPDYSAMLSSSTSPYVTKIFER
jgi:predicted amino acid racemase